MWGSSWDGGRLRTRRALAGALLAFTTLAGGVASAQEGDDSTTTSTTTATSTSTTTSTSSTSTSTSSTSTSTTTTTASTAATTVVETTADAPGETTAPPTSEAPISEPATTAVTSTVAAAPRTPDEQPVITASASLTCRVSYSVHVGATGSAAQCVELALAGLGYTVTTNSVLDDTAAIHLFQTRVGWAPENRVGPAMLNRLGIYQAPPPKPPPPPPPPPPTVSPTCKVSVSIKVRDYGTQVQCLEQALVSRGFSLAGPNLYFDHSTYLAVQAYQRSKGLVTDGVAGPQTLQSLGIWNGPTPSLQGLPANSGTGRRVVYHRGQQRVWAVDGAGNVVKTHRVSGRLYEPYRGTYSVYSRSLYTYAAGNPDVKWRYMVRFAYGPNGGRIGFHEIPNKFGVPLQSVAQLGQPLSGGCVRQSTPDAQWMWNWAGIGTKVVVI